MKNSPSSTIEILNYPIIRTKIKSTKLIPALERSLKNKKLEESRIFKKNAASVKDPAIRRSKSLFLHNSLIRNYLLRKSQRLISKRWKYKKALSSDYVQIAFYQRNDFFSWHVDAEPGLGENHNGRLFTVIFGLSHKKSYRGGELELIDFFGKTHRLGKIDQNEMIIFPSVLKHRVKTVKKSTRKTLTTWLTGHHPT